MEHLEGPHAGGWGGTQLSGESACTKRVQPERIARQTPRSSSLQRVLTPAPPTWRQVASSNALAIRTSRQRRGRRSDAFGRRACSWAVRMPIAGGRRPSSDSRQPNARWSMSSCSSPIDASSRSIAPYRRGSARRHVGRPSGGGEPTDGIFVHLKRVSSHEYDIKIGTRHTAWGRENKRKGHTAHTNPSVGGERTRGRP
eukprot:scaffold10581_cov117-Isochrysis_galbana.AAC.8